MAVDKIVHICVLVTCLSAVCLDVTWAVALNEDCSSADCDTDLVCENDVCKVPPGETDCASTNSNCVANAECSTDTCSCSTGFVAESNACKASAAADGADCTGDMYCVSNAKCIDHDSDGGTAMKCRCYGDYKESSGLCTATAAGDPCTSNADCGMQGTLTCDLAKTTKTCKKANMQPCTMDTNCLGNAMCEMVTGCTMGYCKCKSNYYGTNCYMLKNNGESCEGGGTYICSLTMDMCTSGNCACAGGTTYNTLSGKCLTDTKKELTESCTANSDCEDDGSNGECSADVCACKSGYHAVDYACVKPYYGQSCTSAAGCQKRGTMLGVIQDSNVDPTCQSGTCMCANTVDTQTHGTYKYCIEKYSQTTIANGQTCTSHKMCTSKFCLKCPGVADAKCATFPSSSANSMKAVGMYTMTVAILTFRIFVQM